jgi:hypothetical protein
MNARHAIDVVCEARRQANMAAIRGMAMIPAFIVIGVLILYGALVAGASSASASPSSIIEAWASLSYRDANDVEQPAVRSNIVRVFVTELATVPDVQVTPTNVAGTGSRGNACYYAICVRNQGNSGDSFAFSISSAAGWDTAIYADDSAGDGIHQPLEGTLVYRTGALAVGEAFCGFVRVAVPVDAPEGAGDVAAVTVASESTPGTQATATFTTTTVAVPLMGRVTVRLAGVPLVGARVDVYADDGAWVDSTLTMPPIGAYEFGSELPPGIYRVAASCTGYALQSMSSVAVTTGGTARVDFSLDPDGSAGGLP